MADYYPLLARAVATLPDSTPETRRSIYERARRALLAQLRATDPPLSESALEAESESLDAAIARLESELAAPAADAEPAHAGGLTPPSPPAPPPYTPPSPPAPPAPAQATVQVNPPRSSRAATGEPRPDAGRPEQARPLAPSPPRNTGQFGKSAIWGAAVVVVLAGAGAAAWMLRVPREEFVNPPVTTTQQAAPEAQPQDEAPKVNDRAGAPGEAPAAQQPAAPQSTTRATPQPQQAAAPEVAIAQRAALLVQAAMNDQQNVETHVGTTVWRIEQSERAGVAALPSLRADIDLPPVGLKLAVTIEKNTDATLRASHTLTLRFQQEAGSTLPAVAELGTPQMRNEAAPNVDPLAGVQAKITDNIFIIALTAEPAFAVRNVELLRTRGWFDIPLRLTDGRIAKITIEKGSAGDRLFDQVFNAW